MNSPQPRGFTLIEVAVTLVILSIVTSLLGGIFFQFIRIPPDRKASLDGVNQLRQAGRLLTLDGSRAHSFVLGSNLDYGTFGWQDYTVSPPALHQVRYLFQDGTLVREEKVDGTVFSSTIAASGLAKYEDLKIKACPTFVIATLKVTFLGFKDFISHQEEFYLRLRPEPWGEITAQPLGYALFAGGSGTSPDEAIHWSGSGSLMVGNVHSNGDIVVGGSDNRVTDAITARGTIVEGGQRTTFGSSAPGVPARPMPINCAVTDFPPANFSFSGDVNLVNEPSVWEDWPARTRLRPGIYQATGSISLGQSAASGTVTFIADQVHISGNLVNLRPYYAGITAFGTGTADTAVKVSGLNDLWRGMIYAPQGGVDLAGDGVTVYGSAVAQKIKLTRSGARVLHNAY